LFFCLFRYHTEEDNRLFKLPPVKENHANVLDMIPGEKYVIQVNTVSFGVESTEPLEVTQTVSK
jgi:cadherin 5 type 2 (VE-cadherin)